MSVMPHPAGRERIGPVDKLITPSLYDYPEYYDLAFSFRDIPGEVDVFEECIRRHSRTTVKSVLEVGCGTAPHLEEWIGRGYRYTGFDLHGRMLESAMQKSAPYGSAASIIKADMGSFKLEQSVDFAYVMLGSLYAVTTDELLGHFSSVASALAPGGLYFLDWCVHFGWGENEAENKWRVEKDGVSLEVSYRRDKVLDRAAQVCRNVLAAEVDDHGKRFHLEGEEVSRVIFPQEFLFLVQATGKFEFIGWWNNWDLEVPVEKAERVGRPIVLIRRI